MKVFVFIEMLLALVNLSQLGLASAEEDTKSLPMSPGTPNLQLLGTNQTQIEPSNNKLRQGQNICRQPFQLNNICHYVCNNHGGPPTNFYNCYTQVLSFRVPYCHSVICYLFETSTSSIPTIRPTPTTNAPSTADPMESSTLAGTSSTTGCPSTNKPGCSQVGCSEEGSAESEEIVNEPVCRMVCD